MDDPAQFVGIDLGQTTDHTAMATLERSATERGPAFDVRHLERYPLGLRYTDIVATLRDLLQKPALHGAHVAVDQTGVGRAVVEMLREGLVGLNCTLLPITITGGRSMKLVPGDGIHVPKKTLVGALLGLLQSKRLRIAKTLSDAPVLIKELASFQVKITAARNEIFEAGRGTKDDIICATALGVWMGLHVA
jgi:hypothetical protein